MANQFLTLRNRVHEGEFRFVISASLWDASYISGKGLDAKNILRVMKNGELNGYVIYSRAVFNHTNAYRILEICAEERDTFIDLINRVIERGLEEGIDFILMKESEERHGDVLQEKGFFSIVESAIMIVALNPEEIFSAISQKISRGRIIELNIKGFDPILLKVGEEGAQIVKDEKPHATLSTDGKTFLKLLFGRTSFPREFIRRRITIDNLFDLRTACHLFNLIKQEKWYIPSGDWI